VGNNSDRFVPGAEYGILAVDLATGERTVLSNANIPISGGPLWNSVEDIVINGSIAYVAGINSIIAVQLSDGNRSVVSGAGVPDNNLPAITRAVGVEIDSANNQLFVVDSNFFVDTILAVDLSDGTRSIISQDNNVIPGNTARFSGLWGMALDADNNRLLAVDRFARVWDVDVSTGTFDTFSINGFPDSFSPFSSSTLDIDIDSVNNRAIVLDTDPSRMISVSLIDGSRSHFAEDPTPPAGNRWGIKIDESDNKAYYVNDTQAQLLSVNLTTEAIEIVSDNNLHTGPMFSSPVDVAVDRANNQVYVLDQTIPEIFVVDLTDGSRSILPTTGDPDTTFIALKDATLDTLNNRLLVSDISRDMIIAVDLTTSERSVISSGTYPNSHNAFSYATELVIDPIEQTRAWVSERGLNGILMLDLVTGERVFSSR
jgi:DNA-binding beta-propeller fold protein YncE